MMKVFENDNGGVPVSVHVIVIRYDEINSKFKDASDTNKLTPFIPNGFEGATVHT